MPKKKKNWWEKTPEKEEYVYVLCYRIYGGGKVVTDKWVAVSSNYTLSQALKILLKKYPSMADYLQMGDVWAEFDPERTQKLNQEKENKKEEEYEEIQNMWWNRD